MTTAPIALLILAKAPQAGRVKTRLCPPATALQAARIAAAALLDTLDAVRAVPAARPVIALSGDLTLAERGDELTAALHGIPIIQQRGTSLGERIAAAHTDTATLLPDTPVLQIGMDTPHVDAELLGRCRAVLTDAGTDAVLGPATDGGWWALGLRDPATAWAMATVPTSRSDTGRRTGEALRRAGLRVTPLPALSDVDTMADATRVASTAPDTRFAAAVLDVL
jgi:hypothetical protein